MAKPYHIVEKKDKKAIEEKDARTLARFFGQERTSPAADGGVDRAVAAGRR